jgi:hypothetical protein
MRRFVLYQGLDSEKHDLDGWMTEWLHGCMVGIAYP